jgi:2,5-furandicarboxylate decarboxylase 1
MSLRDTLQIHQKNAARGRATDVAVIVGMDTAVRLASATWGSNIPLELDEFAIAGGLRSQALEMAPCETVDLRVPGDAEIVLEGRILPGALEPEGPMAEFTGVYGSTEPKHVFEATAVMLREEPIYQDIVPFGTEHLLMLGLPYEACCSATSRPRSPGCGTCTSPPEAAASSWRCSRSPSATTATPRTRSWAPSAPSATSRS